VIRTEREYQETQRQLAEYDEAISAQRSQLETAGLGPDEVARGMEPVLAFRRQIEDEIRLYDRIRHRDFTHLDHLSDIGRLLIALRIANGLNQRELAQRLGVHESQVSRDERNEYYGIALERVGEILDAMQETVKLQVLMRAVNYSKHARPSVKDEAQTTFMRARKMSPGEAAVDDLTFDTTQVRSMHDPMR
jgi:transcriptional regulator with XRE-family HTH domain